MKPILIHYRSQELHEDDIVFIKTIMDNRYLRDRSYISRELCKSWNWVQPKGKLKEYAARDLLLRLEEQGLVALPPRIRPKNNLKPRVLSIALRRLSHGWESVYGHPVYLAETFVDAARFQGTCCQAANWMRVGKTPGNAKRGNTYQHHGQMKELYLYSLQRNMTDSAINRIPLPLPARHPLISSLQAKRENGLVAENPDIRGFPGNGRNK